MKSLYTAVAFVILALFATANANAQMEICTVTGTLYKVNGEVWPYATVTTKKVIKSGYLISTLSHVDSADANGFITITVPRNSVAYMYTKAVGLEESGRTGMPLTIPDAATATLSGLVPTTEVPTGYIITVPLLVVNDSTADTLTFGGAFILEWNADGNPVVRLNPDSAGGIFDTLNINTQVMNFAPTTGVPWSEGTMYYDAEGHAFVLYTDITEAALQVGEEVRVRVKNKTGTTIPNGKPVYINGASGQYPTIDLAIANLENGQSAVAGVTTNEIANNDIGYITAIGSVHNMTTLNSFPDSTKLYLSTDTAGGLTAVKPSGAAGKTIVQIGVVLSNNPTQGTLFVDINAKIDTALIAFTLADRFAALNDLIAGKGNADSLKGLVDSLVNVRGALDGHATAIADAGKWEQNGTAIQPKAGIDTLYTTRYVHTMKGDARQWYHARHVGSYPSGVAESPFRWLWNTVGGQDRGVYFEDYGNVGIASDQALDIVSYGGALRLFGRWGYEVSVNSNNGTAKLVQHEGKGVHVSSGGMVGILGHWATANYGKSRFQVNGGARADTLIGTRIVQGTPSTTQYGANFGGNVWQHKDSTADLGTVKTPMVVYDSVSISYGDTLKVTRHDLIEPTALDADLYFRTGIATVIVDYLRTSDVLAGYRVVTDTANGVVIAGVKIEHYAHSAQVSNAVPRWSGCKTGYLATDNYGTWNWAYGDMSGYGIRSNAISTTNTNSGFGNAPFLFMSAGSNTRRSKSILTIEFSVPANQSSTWYATAVPFQ